jgi:FkbM family methyltransferase
MVLTQAFLLKSDIKLLMVTLKGLFLTLKTTRNFWDALSLKNSEVKKKIIFRNGCEVELNWPEYRTVRDIVSKGYSVEYHAGLLCFRKGKIKVAGPLVHIGILNERLDEIYYTDCSNKVVLDVGGFIGETAVFFSAWGAKKVIIYEPVASNHEFIKTNIALNSINAELHEEGIGEKDGYETIHYDALGVGFGFKDKGTHEMQIKNRNIRCVIDESGADIAKFDCEGAEESLLGVLSETLRKIGLYIIEVHTPEVKKALTDKFKSSGFELVKDLPNETDEKVSVIFLQKN